MRVLTKEPWSIVVDSLPSSTEPTHLLRRLPIAKQQCVPSWPCKGSCRQVSLHILQKRKHKSKWLARKMETALKAAPGGTSSKVPIVNSAAFSASFELSGFSCWNTRYPLVVITWDSTPPNTKATFCKRSRSRSWLVYALGRKSHTPETNLCSKSNVQNKPWINIEPFWTLRSNGHWGLASHR